MALLLLVFVSLLTWSGTTFAGVNGRILKKRDIPAPKPYVTTLEQTDDWALLQCEVQDVSPEPKLHWQNRAGNILHAKEPQVTENGYIILRAIVTKTDYYRCNATQEGINHQIDAETYVYFKDPILKDRTAEKVAGTAQKPSIMIVDQTEDWVLLQCEVLGAFPKPKLHWQDSERNILHAEEPQVTERGGRHDIILNITVTKTDNYRCVATQEEKSHQIDAETYVYFTGAAREPYVTTLEQTDDLVLLQCKVHEAVPEPKLHWQDRAGNILHAEEPQVKETGYIILQTTVTKTDYYRCNATYENINHQISAEIYVFIYAPKPSVTTLDQAEDWALLQCKVRDVSPKPKLHWQNRAGNILHAKGPKVNETGYIILQTTVTKTDYYRCVATQQEKSHPKYAETYVHFKGSSAGPVVGAVVGTLLVVVVLGIIVLAVLKKMGYITLNSEKKKEETSLHYQKEAVPLESSQT